MLLLCLLVALHVCSFIGFVSLCLHGLSGDQEDKQHRPRSYQKRTTSGETETEAETIRWPDVNDKNNCAVPVLQRSETVILEGFWCCSKAHIRDTPQPTDDAGNQFVGYGKTRLGNRLRHAL